jgi:hypothetical protein
LTLVQLLNDTAELSAARERHQIDLWRLEQLEAAGWPRSLAFLVALDQEVDLHEACSLVAAGCAPLTALQILI